MSDYIGFLPCPCAALCLLIRLPAAAAAAIAPQRIFEKKALLFLVIISLGIAWLSMHILNYIVNADCKVPPHLFLYNMFLWCIRVCLPWNPISCICCI